MTRSEKEDLYHQLLLEKSSDYEIEYARDLYAEYQRGESWAGRFLDGAIRHLTVAFPKGPSLDSYTIPPEAICTLAPIPVVYDARKTSCNPRNRGAALHNIVYLSGDVRMRGICAAPVGDAPCPLLIFNHGGGWGLSQVFRAMMMYFAGHGFLVLASTYRGEAGPEGRADGRRGDPAGEILDVVRLLELGSQLPRTQGFPIGMIGDSHGGRLTLEAVAVTNLVDTAVALCPDIRCEGNVTPAVRQVLSRYEHLRGASDAVIEREVQLRSPILRVSQIALQHLWIIAAEQDQIISLDIVQRYVQTLTENRISHTFTTIPGADHLFYYYWRNFEPVPGSQRTLWWQVLQYFQTHLKR